MVECPECGEEIEEGQVKCPNCGFKIGFQVEEDIDLPEEDSEN